MKNLITNRIKSKGSKRIKIGILVIALATVGLVTWALFLKSDENHAVVGGNNSIEPVNEAADEEAAIEEKRNQDARAVYQTALDVINSDSPDESELTSSYITAAYYAAFFKEDQAKEYATKALERMQPPDLENHPGTEEQKQQELRNYEETRKDMELIRDGNYEKANEVNPEE